MMSESGDTAPSDCVLPYVCAVLRCSPVHNYGVTAAAETATSTAARFSAGMAVLVNPERWPLGQPVIRRCGDTIGAGSAPECSQEPGADWLQARKQHWCSQKAAIRRHHKSWLSYSRHHNSLLLSYSGTLHSIYGVLACSDSTQRANSAKAIYMLCRVLRQGISQA